MKNLKTTLSYFKFVFLISLVVMVIMMATKNHKYIGPPIIVMFSSLALFFMSHTKLKSFAFTIWVFAFASAALFYHKAFLVWKIPWFDGQKIPFELSILIVPLIQIIMFGMGTTLSLADFGRVFKMPWPVLVGMVLQFSIMPLTGLCIALLLGIKGEMAAGVVLIGSCPGGVASNLMTFLAGGDVALSVTMTSCSTLASPIMTPLMMDKLASRFVDINFLQMMFNIINMIIVPIAAGLIANRILYSKKQIYHSVIPVAVIGIVCIVAGFGIVHYVDSAVFTYNSRQETEIVIKDPNVSVPDYALAENLENVEYIIEPETTTIDDPNATVIAKGIKTVPISLKKDGFVVGFLLIGVVALAQLIVRIIIKGPEHWMDKVLPLVSMVGICVIIAIITAKSKVQLMAEEDFALKAVGLLAIAAIIHNALGYIFGYWAARLARLNETACRTVAIEVGLQNGGMASGLAMDVLVSAKAAIAPAIFGPWMNVSGSILASWWRKKPVRKTVNIKQSEAVKQ